ncbi:hypothetical protein M9978_22190 [Sphingomonas sp. MG17]|uniref:Uncharacterized protein n=1 Tax=Sphingomonas tagetis TaxID=2949092 RepID=A0A9X2KP09_9SPHN|nr:hypothetical protein [Sphingomonas tagetis]
MFVDAPVEMDYAGKLGRAPRIGKLRGAVRRDCRIAGFEEPVEIGRHQPNDIVGAARKVDQSAVRGRIVEFGNKAGGDGPADARRVELLLEQGKRPISRDQALDAIDLDRSRCGNHCSRATIGRGAKMLEDGVR